MFIVRPVISIFQRRTSHVLLACLACPMLSLAACDARKATPLQPSPTRVSPFTLSGQIFDVTAGRRVAAADVPVLGVFLTGRPGGTRSWSATYRSTTTGSDGRYEFPEASGAIAIVRTHLSTHRQICAATTELSGTNQLDVEITSSTVGQALPATLTPLRVTGQIYEMTPAGRVGIGGAEIFTQWANDGPFITFYADANGRYTACGIPANWPIGYEIYRTGYSGAFAWRQFSGDGVFDIELKKE